MKAAGMLLPHRGPIANLRQLQAGGAERNSGPDLTQHAAAAIPVRLALNCKTSGHWIGPVTPAHLLALPRRIPMIRGPSY